MPQTASDLRGGRTGGQADRITFQHQLRGCECDAALLVGKTRLALRKGCIEAERLIGQLACQLDASMRALHHPALLQLDQVASYAGRRRVNSSGQVLDAALTCFEEQVEDLARPFVVLCRHTREISLPATSSFLCLKLHKLTAILIIDLTVHHLSHYPHPVASSFQELPVNLPDRRQPWS